MANILIVEDEPRMRRLLEISLSEDGHSAHTSGDAESGLQHLRKASVRPCGDATLSCLA